MLKLTNQAFPYSLLAILVLLTVPGCHAFGCPVRESDAAIVNRALDVYGKGKVDRDQLRRSFDIAVVYLPKMTCVGFNVKAGTAGGDETLCFDKTGREVISYSNGD